MNLHLRMDFLEPGKIAVYCVDILHLNRVLGVLFHTQDICKFRNSISINFIIFVHILIIFAGTLMYKLSLNPPPFGNTDLTFQNRIKSANQRSHLACTSLFSRSTNISLSDFAATMIVGKLVLRSSAGTHGPRGNFTILYDGEGELQFSLVKYHIFYNGKGTGAYH